MCQITYKTHFCLSGTHCLANNGWVNLRGELWVRPYKREAIVQRQCAGLRHRGCFGQEYIGAGTGADTARTGADTGGDIAGGIAGDTSDTKESWELCPWCEAYYRRWGGR